MGLVVAGSTLYSLLHYDIEALKNVHTRHFRRPPGPSTSDIEALKNVHTRHFRRPPGPSASDIEALKKCQKEQSEALKGLSSVVMKKEGEPAVLKATEVAVVPDKK